MSVPLISICIPTYNRSVHLKNCLASIVEAVKDTKFPYEICISNNASEDDTANVIDHFREQLNLVYKENSKNIGVARNILNVVSMAGGEFTWLVGDDDLLLPDSLQRLGRLIRSNPQVDFIYGNSYQLDSSNLRDRSVDAVIAAIDENTPRFSSWDQEGPLPFLSLIDPDVSFDYLGGMFLSVFRRENWVENVSTLDQQVLEDERLFSHFENTFPHVAVFAAGFSGSQAYFNATPLNICLSGVREWSVMSPLINSFRLIEALGWYSRYGLPRSRYLRYKNYSLRGFLPDLARMLVSGKRAGLHYISPKLLLSYLLYPNTYLSIVYYLVEKIRSSLSSNR